MRRWSFLFDVETHGREQGRLFCNLRAQSPNNYGHQRPFLVPGCVWAGFIYPRFVENVKACIQSWSQFRITCCPGKEFHHADIGPDAKVITPGIAKVTQIKKFCF